MCLCPLGIYGDDWHFQAAEISAGGEWVQPFHSTRPSLLPGLFPEMLRPTDHLGLWIHFERPV